MASVDFRCDSNDLACHLPKSDNNYFTALDATEASEATEHSVFYVGQRYKDPTYYIYRGAVCFDTSGLDDNCLIVSAILTLRCGSNYASTLIIQSGAPTYPHIPQVVGDYNRTHYSGNGGSFIAAAGNDIVTLNADGRTWINKTGYTKFLLRSQAEIKREAPTAEMEFAQFYGNYTSEVAWRPKLTVEYALPTDVPIVISEGPCTNRQSTTMTAVGNVTDDGGGYEERGFEYYENSAIYDSEMYAVREKGVFIGTGNYEMTIYGLKPQTTYKIRAWVLNRFGINYGEWYTCITTKVPSYGIHEEANTAKYKLYVSDDEAIAWRGYKGPYSGKQSYINITDITNKTKGVKVLKIVPDTKGTFHVCVTVKQELKN